MQNLLNDLIKYVGDETTVDTVIQVVNNHVGTVECEAHVPEFEHKYGDDHMRYELDRELTRQMTDMLVHEILRQDLIEVSEEYSAMHRSFIKKVSLKIIKKDKEAPRHQTLRW